MQELIGYLRVSTKEQGMSNLGLEAQEAAIMRFAAQNNCVIIKVFKEVLSGKLDVSLRPALKEAIKYAIRKKAILVTSALDRLSRNAAFILNLMESRLNFRVADIGMQQDELQLHIRAIIAENERKKIGERTKSALSVLKAQGVSLGNPHKYDTKNKQGIYSCAKKGGEATKEIANMFMANIEPMLKRMLKEGMSFNAIAKELDRLGVKTARGGIWTAKNVSNIVERMKKNA